jgi:Putative transposase DNA-binding domain
MTPGSSARGHGGGGAVTLRLPLALSPRQDAEALRIRRVCLGFQHELADGLSGRAAFKVAGLRAAQHDVPPTYLMHVARAVSLMRREGHRLTRWSRLALITGGEQVRVLGPQQVCVAGLGVVRGELFRLLGVDPRTVPRPAPGLAALLAERARIEAAEREESSWPGASPAVRKVVLLRRSGGEWWAAADVVVPDLGLVPVVRRVMAGLDVGLSPLGVLATDDGRVLQYELGGVTAGEIRRTERLARRRCLDRGLTPAQFRLHRLHWRQAIHAHGLAALSPLLEQLPTLSSLATEGLSLTVPRDAFEVQLSRYTRPFGLPEVLSCLPEWCRQSGTVLREVDGSYSSRTCPRCGGGVMPGRVHVACPACGHSGNRHAWAAEVLMQRGARR